MNKRDTTEGSAGSFGNDLANGEPHGHDDTHLKPVRSLEEIVSLLNARNTLRDKLSRQGDTYEVETVIQVNDREWYFLATVRHNGKEITDDIELASDELRRNRATQSNKTKALWNLFVKEAAEAHLEKCRAVKRRFEKSNPTLWHNKKHVLTLLGVLVLTLAGIGIYMGFVTSPPSKPTAQTPPADHRAAEEPALATDAQPADVPQAGQKPLMKGRETPERLQQQAAPQLSPEEIKQRVKKLLNNQK